VLDKSSAAGRRDFAMFRRLIISLLFLLPAAVCAEVQTQTRIGILVQELERAQSQAIKGLGEGLKTLGYQEKKNFVFETRNVKGNRAALQGAATELLARNVQVVFTTGTSATRAALTASGETPVVFVYPGDPRIAGLIKSAEERPKNLTGVAAYAAATTDKRLALINEIVPDLKKIFVFYDADNSYSRQNYSSVEGAAKKLGLQAEGYAIKSSDELKTTIGSLRSEPSVAIFQIADDLFESDSEFLFETARAKKLPTMFNEEAWAIRGALAAYGPSYAGMGRQAARLIDRIMKGEKPGSLSIEKASKFDLTLNYRTAKFIGIRFSPETLKRADKVIR
jgi:putative tryptophan/tyrosine transport system substrate-binding protein